MDIHSAQFQLFTSTLSRLFDEGKPFTAYNRGDQFYVQETINSNWEIDSLNAEFLLDHAIRELNERNLREIPLEETRTLAKLTNLACRAVKELGNSYQDHDEALTRLKSRALCAKLGGLVSEEAMNLPQNQELIKVIKENSLHHQFQALRMQMREQGGFLQLAIESEDGTSQAVSWEDVRKEIVYDDAGNQIGFSYRNGDTELFRTDTSYSINDNYVMTYKGLKKHNPYESQEIITYDKLPADDKYTLQIVTVLKDLDGTYPGTIAGNHSFCILKDREGNLKSDGKFGPFNRYSCADMTSPLGRKEGKQCSPDIYVYFAEDTRSFKMHTIEISAEQYNKVLSRWESDNQIVQSFSLLKTNCSSYVKEILEKDLDIRIDVGMTIFRYCLSQILPKSWMQAGTWLWNKTMKPLPQSVQKILYFLPFIYMPLFIANLGARILSLINDENHYGGDLNLIDILFKPWTCVVDHPLSLREGLNDLLGDEPLAID